ncbi:hypothetical protein B0H13DRAFT_2306972 [Mycena leptocephala]|nr:hypothetical protein B0H13DRAFT_2306972 [Mycena leptocephala]
MEEGEDEDPLLLRGAATRGLPHVSNGFVINAPQAMVSRTFENRSPAATITFLDSGATDHFFRNRTDFATYEVIPMRTGKSALSSEGDFPVIGKGTVTKLFHVTGKTVHITFKNALHAPSLSANLISVSHCSSYHSGLEISPRD